MELTEADIRRYMERCVQVAKLAPANIKKPHVGALVLSSDGEVVGEGHKSFLESTSLIAHAERMALDNAGDLADGGYLFTTLEPCIDYKIHLFKPCCELIVERGIDTVAVAFIDVQPRVNGMGVKYLRDRRVRVLRYDGLDDTIKRELMGVNRKYDGTVTHR